MSKNGKNQKSLKKMIVNTVKDIASRDIESKYTDVDLTGVPFRAISAGNTFQLSNVAEGTGDDQRIGSMLRAYKFTLRMNMLYFDPNTTLTAPATIRVIVFRNNCQGDQNDNQAFVLKTGTTPIEAMYNWVNRSILQILHDKSFVIDPIQAPRQITHEINIFKTMVMKYDGAGAAPNGKGRLQLLVTSDIADPVVAPQVVFASRMWYKDA